MDHFWLLTWTTYGTWLPGDARGFVSYVRGPQGHGIRHNVPHTDYDAALPRLRRFMQASLRGGPVYLTVEQAPVLLAQFQETAAHRGWLLLAAAIVANHVHLVVGVPADPDPARLLNDFKSYGTRALNRLGSKPESGTWWTESGSRRKLPDEAAISAAVRYVREQAFALLVWSVQQGPEGRGGAAST